MISKSKYHSVPRDKKSKYHSVSTTKQKNGEEQDDNRESVIKFGKYEGLQCESTKRKYEPETHLRKGETESEEGKANVWQSCFGDCVLTTEYFTCANVRREHETDETRFTKLVPKGKNEEVTESMKNGRMK